MVDDIYIVYTSPYIIITLSLDSNSFFSYNLENISLNINEFNYIRITQNYYIHICIKIFKMELQIAYSDYNYLYYLY